MSKNTNIILALKKLSKLSAVFLILMGCKNSTKEINDFLADKNLPIGVTENVNYIYKDSGVVTIRTSAPLYWDFTNRELNPYNEFPKGIKIVKINRISGDSITVIGDYAISYDKTKVSEIIGNVVVINHHDEVTLNTDKMYWDQKENYYFSKSPFTIFTETDTITGVGFESNSDLTNWILNNTKGDFIVDQKEK